MVEENKTEDGWEEIMGKDIMMKKLKRGTGEIASMGTVVTCNIKGYFKSDESHDDTPFESLTNQQFKIGESDAIPALELTLRHSTVGAIFEMKCSSRFAYGPIGRPAVSGQISKLSASSGRAVAVDIPAIPANMDLFYQVEVIDHTNEGSVDQTILFDILERNGEDISAKTKDSDIIETEVPTVPEKYHNEYNRRVALRDILLRKECGNRWFSYLDYPRAARAYSKGTQIADNYFKSSAPTATVEEGKEGKHEDTENGGKIAEHDLPIVHVYVACLNNLSACHLGMGEALKAKDMCIKVLEFDPLNEKALLRAAKATLAMHDFHECEVCLKKVLEMSPNNTAATSEMNKLRRAQKEYQAKSKEMQKNMAKKLFPGSSDKQHQQSVTPTNTPQTQKLTNDDSADSVSPLSDSSPNDKKDTSTAATNSKGVTEGDNKITLNSVKKEENVTGKSIENTEKKNEKSDKIMKTDNKNTENEAKKSSVSNLVVFLVTSLLVIIVSIYIAVFAKYK